MTGSPDAGNGVSPFSMNFAFGGFSFLEAPNSLCQKPDFCSGAGSGIGTSNGSVAATATVGFGAVTICGAGFTCTTCTGAASAGCAGAGLAVTTLATGGGFAEMAGCDVTTLEIFGCGLGSGAGFGSGGFAFAMVVVTADAGASNCSRPLASAFTSSQFAGRGVSAR